jgi:hypothetical protein
MDDGAYAALHRVIGWWFNRFLNDLARPHRCATTIPDAERAADKQREPSGYEWVGKPGISPVSPERLPQHGEGWWLAFEPSVAGEAHKEPRDRDPQQQCGKSGVDVNGYCLATLPIDSVI